MTELLGSASLCFHIFGTADALGPGLIVLLLIHVY